MKKRTFIITAIILIAAGIIYIDRFYDKFHVVVDGKIYRSGQLSKNRLQEVISDYRIKSVLNLRGENSGDEWFDQEKKIVEKNNGTYYNLDLRSNIFPPCTRLDHLVNILQSAKRPMLIHCQGGIDRTGMASALALAIETNPPIESVKKHFSWRYLVVPGRNSAGPLLFNLYENWLKKNSRDHSRETLLYWLKNKYVDCAGNIEFRIMRAQYKSSEKYALFNEDRKAVIENKSKPLQIKGWAFDLRNKVLPEALVVVVDDKNIYPVKYMLKKPTLCEDLGLDDSFKDVKFKWVATIGIGEISPGCHKISFRIRNFHIPQAGRNLINIPPYDNGCPSNYELCIK